MTSYIKKYEKERERDRRELTWTVFVNKFSRLTKLVERIEDRIQIMSF